MVVFAPWASQVTQWVKNLPAMQETLWVWVQFLHWEDPLEEGMATHSSILAWRIPWTEEPGELQSIDCKESDMTEATEPSTCTHSHRSLPLARHCSPSAAPQLILAFHHPAHDAESQDRESVGIPWAPLFSWGCQTLPQTSQMGPELVPSIGGPMGLCRLLGAEPQHIHVTRPLPQGSYMPPHRWSQRKAQLGAESHVTACEGRSYSGLT